MKIKIDWLEIKMQLFEFPYTSLKDFYKCVMFVFIARDCHQIFRPIIIPNPVNVVDNPALRQWLPMGFFPDKNMFSYVAKLVGSWMPLFKSKYVALVRAVTPIPFPMGFTCGFILKPMFRVQLIAQFKGFCACSSGQSSLYKQLVYRGTLATGWGITKMKSYIIEAHVFLPMKLKKLLVCDGLGDIYSFRHTINIPYKSSYVKSFSEFIYAY